MKCQAVIITQNNPIAQPERAELSNKNWKSKKQKTKSEKQGINSSQRKRPQLLSLLNYCGCGSCCRCRTAARRLCQLLDPTIVMERFCKLWWLWCTWCSRWLRFLPRPEKFDYYSYLYYHFPFHCCCYKCFSLWVLFLVFTRARIAVATAAIAVTINHAT